MKWAKKGRIMKNENNFKLLWNTTKKSKNKEEEREREKRRTNSYEMIRVHRLCVETVLIQSKAIQTIYSCHRYSQSQFTIRIYLNTPNSIRCCSSSFFALRMRMLHVMLFKLHCIALKYDMVWPIDDGHFITHSAKIRQQ